MNADTALKRFSAMSFNSPWRGLAVIPAVTITQGERQAALLMYAGILAGTVLPPTPSRIPGWRRPRTVRQLIEDLKEEVEVMEYVAPELAPAPISIAEAVRSDQASAHLNVGLAVTGILTVKRQRRRRLAHAMLLLDS